jgi:DNA-directed RNA polymerase specialized sigma24 family protein
MPFTARDLRYRPEQSYPLLYAYLHRNAQRYLGAFRYDAFEVDTVIGHVVEQLVRLGLLGGGDKTPLGALDRLTDAQFYAFLNRSVKNKAIDRLRKRRLQVSTASELEAPGDVEDEDPLEDAVEPAWGAIPFSTPEAITLHLASQQELRAMLKHCILVLSVAPHQLQAVMQELREYGADELLGAVIAELRLSLPAAAEETDQPTPHMSQHKDHAHKKLRRCLQQQSTNLTVAVALRLTDYKQLSTATNNDTITIQDLAQGGLSVDDVRAGLKELVAEGLLDWHGEDDLHLTAAQVKRLARFYREE